MAASISMALGWLLLAVVLTACEQVGQPCRRSSDCREHGFCTERGDECIAASDADCRRATTCFVHGNCKARDGKCVKR
jgi:hypothetical protein